MQIKNSIFLVTGGASGLGAASARMAAENGAKVVIADLQAEPGEKLAKEIGGRFVQHRRYVGGRRQGGGGAGGEGIRRPARAGELRRHRARRAHPRQGSAARPGRFTKVLTVNVIGTFNMIRLAADAMAKAAPNAAGERGVIVNTASVAAYDGQIGQAAYSASKGGDRRHDAADRARPVAQRHPRLHHRAGHLRDAAARWPAQGGAGVARQAGAVPLAPGPAGRSSRRW